MTRLILPAAAALMGSGAVAQLATPPWSEYGPLAQMGAAGVVLGLWWVERRERRERQEQDDERYAKLQSQLMDALKRPVRCPFATEDGHTIKVVQ